MRWEYHPAIASNTSQWTWPYDVDEIGCIGEGSVRCTANQRKRRRTEPMGRCIGGLHLCIGCNVQKYLNATGIEPQPGPQDAVKQIAKLAGHEIPTAERAALKRQTMNANTNADEQVADDEDVKRATGEVDRIQAPLVRSKADVSQEQWEFLRENRASAIAKRVAKAKLESSTPTASSHVGPRPNEVWRDHGRSPAAP